MRIAPTRGNRICLEGKKKSDSAKVAVVQRYHSSPLGNSMCSLSHFWFGWNWNCAKEYFILWNDNLCHYDPNFKQCAILEVTAFSQNARDTTDHWKRGTALSSLGYITKLPNAWDWKGPLEVQPHCSGSATKSQ